MEQKLFRMKADVTFMADSIDDAFERLSDHFQSLSKQGLDGYPLLDLQSGEINIYPEVAK